MQSLLKSNYLWEFTKGIQLELFRYVLFLEPYDNKFLYKPRWSHPDRPFLYLFPIQQNNTETVGSATMFSLEWNFEWNFEWNLEWNFVLVRAAEYIMRGPLRLHFASKVSELPYVYLLHFTLHGYFKNTVE